MPYIPKLGRIDSSMHDDYYLPDTIGGLNYMLTMLCRDFLPKKHSYEELNEIIGVLECVKQEFYRRVVVPYEEIKMKENGDVY